MKTNLELELAKKSLEKYKIKHNAAYRGVSISEFTKEELSKIIDMYADLIKRKDETINCLSRL